MAPRNLIGLGQTDKHYEFFNAKFRHITLSFRKGNNALSTNNGRMSNNLLKKQRISVHYFALSEENVSVA
jgi:hypothetical protein